jgi:hypothetical protein
MLALILKGVFITKNTCKFHNNNWNHRNLGLRLAKYVAIY